MKVKRYKPTSPSRRYYEVLAEEGLTKKEPERALLEAKSRSGGRNNSGRITSRFRGGAR